MKKDPLGWLVCRAKLARKCFFEARIFSHGPPSGGVSNGGASRSGLVLPFCPFLSFLGLSRFFRDFPDLLGDGPGNFPDSSLFSFSAYKEHLRVPEKSGKHPGLETPGLASLNFSRKMLRNFPRNFWAFISWVRKNPTKFSPNFPQNLPLQNQKNNRRASAGVATLKTQNWSRWPLPSPIPTKESSSEQSYLRFGGDLASRYPSGYAWVDVAMLKYSRCPSGPYCTESTRLLQLLRLLRDVLNCPDLPFLGV